MRTFAKLTIMMGILVLFFAYGSAQNIKTGWKTGGNKIITTQVKPPKNTLQKSWTKIPCELQTWFMDKVNRIKAMCTTKIDTLTKMNTSLESIIPLVKNTTIKSALTQEQKEVQTMTKNYTELKARIDKDPKNTCWQWMNPPRKVYNEQTKTIVDHIKAQFDLLKKKK